MSVDLSKITNSSGVTKSKDSVVGIGATATRTTAQAHPDKGIDPNDKHLCTDYLLTNLKGRTISGAFITIVAKGAQFVLDAPPRRQLRSVGAISRLRQADQSWELEAISMTSEPLQCWGGPLEKRGRAR